MKTIGIAVSTIAIALGILVGRLDYDEERAGARSGHGDRRFLDGVPGAIVDGDPDPESSDPPPAGFLPRPRDERGPRNGQTASVEARERFSSRSRASDETFSSSGNGRETAPGTQVDGLDAGKSGLEERLEEIEQRIALEDFVGAEDAAKAFLVEPDLQRRNDRGPHAAHDRALRLAAKARSFAAVFRSFERPASAGAAPRSPATSREADSAAAEERFQLLLANGSTVIGRKVDEDATRYVLELEGGGTFAPRREDVLEARAVKGGSTPPAARKDSAWKDIEPKIARLTHPIDLFVDGVERCWRMGLRKEALGLLEKVLADPRSDQIPLIFVPDATESLLGDWQVAAGRTSAADLEGGVQPRSSDDHSESTDREPRGAAANPASLSKAAVLLGQAQALYQSAVGKDGGESDLRAARQRLESALGVIAGLPPADGDVKQLRREIAQLLSDVARASPF
ncbi:MAG TPA: hypothetical protein VMT52_01125 [Planctomycetota bacterium]|nr:hypothetical protein [Planctomycetota bacterium]